VAGVVAVPVEQTPNGVRHVLTPGLALRSVIGRVGQRSGLASVGSPGQAGRLSYNQVEASHAILQGKLRPHVKGNRRAQPQSTIYRSNGVL